MKTSSLIAAGLFMIFGFAAQAQELLEPAVKILPTSEKGIVKVLYAYPTGQSVNVKFVNEDGLIGSDRILAAAYQNGFTKKYDIRNMGSKSFWVEVSSAKMSVTYKMVASKERGRFVPVLEKNTYLHPLTAASN
jgi:hypothetical protein